MIFSHFYSDSHFGHANIIQYSKRPFADVEAMNAALEANYREQLLKDLDWAVEGAFVLWVGDCALGRYDLKGLLARLPGRKALVRGNHDGRVANLLDAGFEFVVDKLWLNVAGRKTLVCHFPPKGGGGPGPLVGEAPQGNEADIFIHGHTHEPGQVYGRRIHVGVDAWNYRPASLSEIEALARL